MLHACLNLYYVISVGFESSTSKMHRFIIELYLISSRSIDGILVVPNLFSNHLSTSKAHKRKLIKNFLINLSFLFPF